MKGKWKMAAEREKKDMMSEQDLLDSLTIRK